MSDYETDEQQIEALKKWWNENATSLLLGLSAGAIILGGWSYYSKTQHQHRIEASDIYIVAMSNIESGKKSNIDDGVTKLVEAYSDTPYAAMALLANAKLKFQKGDIDAAIQELKLVNESNAGAEIFHTARLRLARLLIEKQKFGEAESVLLSGYPDAFAGLYEELKGDLFVATGKIQQARVAYDKAIKHAGTESRLLQIKRRELGDMSSVSEGIDSAA